MAHLTGSHTATWAGQALDDAADRLDEPSAITLQDGLRALASVDQDRAAAINGIGFNKLDGDFGHKLALIPDARMSPKQKRAAWVMLRKYRNQLASNFGIDFDAIGEPPAVTPEMQAEYEAARDRRRGITAPATGTNPRRFAWPNPQAPHIAISFPYDPALLAELKHSLAGIGLRWQQEPYKHWRLEMPRTPEDCGIVLAFARDHGFAIEPILLGRFEDGERAGRARRAASTATTSTYEGPKLLRELYPFQKAGVEYVVRHAEGRAMIADEMGLGKSIQSIAAMHALNAYPVLMITKATTKYAMRDEWLATIPGMKPEDVYVIGPKIDAERLEAASVAILNYDLVSRHLDQLLAIRFDGMIVDESHRCKSHTAQRTEAIKALATGRRQKRNEDGKGVTTANGRRVYETVSPGIRSRILLTGTPIINRPSEIIAQLEIMGRLDDLGGFWTFRDKYCNLEDNGFGMTERAGDTRVLEALNERMRAICYVARKKKDVAPELPAIQRTILPVELPALIRREYAKAERNIIRFVGDRAAADRAYQETIAHLSPEDQAAAIRAHRNEAEARAARAQAIVMIGELRQIAGRGKVEAAKEWIEDFLQTGEKLILFSRHIEVQRAIMEAWPTSAHIFGGDSAEARQANVRRFQGDPVCQLIVCATEAASEGVTLTAASHVAFIELEWTPAAHDQAEARCYGRINDMHGASAWYFLAEGTIDRDMWELLAAKREVCAALTEGAARSAKAHESVMGDVLRRIAAKA